MSERDLPLLLLDIKVAIQSILNYTAGYTLDAYEQDQKTRHAVERNFEIIGEAASRIPQEYKDLHPDIEWRIIKDFRNFIIHDYFGINNEILWIPYSLAFPIYLLTLPNLYEQYINYRSI